MMASAYAKLIYMPRPVSNRRKMDVGHRAKQFAPFSALRGFEESVRKKEILYSGSGIWDQYGSKNDIYRDGDP